MSASPLLASLPNLITLARLVMVPVVILAIVQSNWLVAFLIFLAAGISDAVDGFLAKRFDMKTELGAYLDPLADKALLVSIYVALAVENILPAFLTITVVSRDVMILGAVVVSWALDRPVAIAPLFVSKANTAAQIGLAAAVLAAKAFELKLGVWVSVAVWTVMALTIASGIAYFIQWLQHMNADDQ